MNTYLFHLGCQLVEIRRLLNWTQDDLAKRVGVSRPVIVNIENDPEKMTKNIALAMFVNIKGELQIRKSKLSTIDFEQAPTEVKKQIEQMGITSTTVRIIAPFVGGLFGGVIGFAAGSWLLKKVIDDTFIVKDIKPAVEKIADRIESKLKEFLALTCMREEELLKAIDNGEKYTSINPDSI